jgi:hypothetical protein
MTGLTFPWIFIALAAAVDVVGLFYLWRRRNSGVGANRAAVGNGARLIRIPLTERRRGERRGNGKAAAARHPTTKGLGRR